MSEYRFRFTEATPTPTVLRNLIDDVEHLLHWLTVAQGFLVIINAIHLIGSIAERSWIEAAFNALLAGLSVAWAIATNRRQEKYRGVRR